MEPVHRGLGVDRVDRNEWPGQDEQIERGIAEDLIGDVHVAALGVACPRNLRHRLRLVQGLTMTSSRNV